MPSMASPDQVSAILDGFVTWAMDDPSISAVGLVGSWARGEARDESDVDLVVLTTEPDRFLEHDDWFPAVGASAKLIRNEDFGVIQERRLLLPSGLEVEVGFGLPSWAATEPVDDGTRRVASEGMTILHDPLGLLRTLLDVVVPLHAQGD